MNLETTKHTTITVRGTAMKLMTYTRSLELCARMNYETENLDFIDKIKPGEILYDLGACEGRFSVYAALKNVRVISFEPEAKNFQVLNENLLLNELGKDKVMPVNSAIGAENGKATLDIGQPWEGGHQKVVNHNEVRNDLKFDFVDKQEVKVVALDSFIGEGNPQPDYLKIDIDGSEMPFLKGANKVFDSTKLKGLIFELNEKDPNFSSIEAFFKSKNFSESSRYQVPNEPGLYNIIYYRN